MLSARSPKSRVARVRSPRMPPSVLKKMFVILNFVVLSFLWDGNSDIYCRTTAKLLRSGNEGSAGDEIDSFLENKRRWKLKKSCRSFLSFL